MGNTLEIHDGDFHLTIYLDKLHSFPRANFCRLLRLLRRYPDAMEPLGTYLQSRMGSMQPGVRQWLADRKPSLPYSGKHVEAVREQTARKESAYRKAPLYHIHAFTSNL